MTLPTRRAVRLVLAAAAVGAGAIHLAFAPEHLEEWLPLGLGFVVTGVLQVAVGVGLALRDSRRMLVATATLSSLAVVAYLVSRTSGFPVGPEAFEPEPLGLADLVCCALEVPVALISVLLARRPTALRAPLSRRMGAVLLASFVLVGAGTGVAVAAPGHEGQGHEGHHAHESCPSAPELTGVTNAQGVDTGVTAYFTCLLQSSHSH